jgi:hypothetical protein
MVHALNSRKLRKKQKSARGGSWESNLGARKKNTKFRKFPQEKKVKNRENSLGFELGVAKIGFEALSVKIRPWVSNLGKSPAGRPGGRRQIQHARAHARTEMSKIGAF